MKRSAVLSCVVLVLAACPSGRPRTLRLDLRGVFAAQTYPEARKVVPEVDHLLQFYAIAQLELLTAWEHPARVADCLDALDAAWLRQVQEALRTRTEVERLDWPTAVSQVVVSPVATVSPRLPGACLALWESPGDRALFAYSFARYADAVGAHIRGTLASAAEVPARFEAAAKAQWRVARLLRRSSPRSDGPVLALSGGAANGAFPAGFLFELLSARERALAEVRRTDAPAAQAAELATRFEGVVGTSVGALLAQLLDVYAIDDVGLSPPVVAALEACLSEALPPELPYVGPPPAPGCFAAPPPGAFPGGEIIAALAADPSSRRPQLCALRLLLKEFAYNTEKRLMCVEEAPVTGLVGMLSSARPGFIRFDPMTSTIIDPLLANFGPLLNENALLRTVVAVDVMQNQTLGLDERACAGLPARGLGSRGVAEPGSLEYCLSSGAMASVVLPLFARPVRHTWSGLTDGGECSAWLDGGLRSGFPAYRALRLSRPLASNARLRVLALETTRFDGLPSPRPFTVADVGLNAINQMSSQLAVDEAIAAQRFAEGRREDFTALCQKMVPDGEAPPSLCGRSSSGPLKVAGGLEADETLVLPVFVPSDAPPALMAEAGYSFDQYVMRGLFVWGRRAAIARLLGDNVTGGPRPSLAAQLGWSELDAHMKAAAAHDAAGGLAAWAAAYAQPECSHLRRFEAGRARILGEVPYCEVLSSQPPTQPGTPHYFACPAGGAR